MVRRVVGQLSAFGFPLGAATVHKFHLGVSIVLHLPEGPGSEPVVVVSVQDNGGVVADARVAEKRFHIRFADQVSAYVLL